LAANTTTQTGGKRALGVCDGTRQWCMAVDDIDAADPTVADSWAELTHALVSITAGTPAVDDSYFITHHAEGFTYQHDTASGTAIQVIYLVGGDAPIFGDTGGPIYRPRKGYF